MLLALLLILPALGCRSMWDRVRENERVYAVETARTQTGRGQCRQALSSLDRAQARLDLGLYARESTLARMRCYQKLDQDELAAAHRRLIDDFYTDEPMAIPDATNASVFRVASVPSGSFDRPPSWLEIPRPRYTPYAQRSDIIGRVVVSFELGGNDRPRKIRVLEMPHPLLASWAIEAVAAAKPSQRKKKNAPTLMPGGRFLTTFVFEWRWAEPRVDPEYAL